MPDKPTPQDVAEYYDSTQELWLSHLGTTIQAGILSTDATRQHIQAHNVMLARRAGVVPGCRVLDAGCGFCGPAIDIAGHFAGVTVDAITISPRQARYAADAAMAAGLANRVRVCIADYHALPFCSSEFDVVQFLESASHSHDHPALFCEAFRVLRPGGCLYVKDGFLKEHRSAAETEANRDMNTMFRMNTTTLAKLLLSIKAAGFAVQDSRELSAVVNPNYFMRAMLVDPARSRASRSPLGEAHYLAGDDIKKYNWPVIAEIKALKPG